MKVALLAGGMGTRLREETEYRPKPMVEIGGRSDHVAYHDMYSYYTLDFVICSVLTRSTGTTYPKALS
jgi:glucose-1-phosphate cytidylyltransferase